MKNKIIKVLSILSICLLITSCQDPIVVINGGDATSFNTKTNIGNKIALICNLTKVDANKYGGWDGDCPGTDVDARNFKSMCSSYNIPCVTLENKECTSENVISMWKYCLSHINPTNGLFIFYYSGHGGQVYSTTEEDGLDETLCFWDGQFKDDYVWQLVNMVPKTCRCFMVTDCCNSGTNFRMPFNMGKTKKKIKFLSRGQEPNLLHYGGCVDGDSSYGSVIGGVFTLSLKRNFDKNLTYKQWFDKCQTQVKSKGLQVPTFAETGISFKNERIFE